MLTKIRNANRLNELLFLGGLSLFCFALTILRHGYSDTKAFLFLNWNLFLAFIPWLLTTWLIIHPKIQQNKIIVGLVICVWLLFFPNAPYILTDLFHLRLKLSMPIWFDLVLILSFAWTGILFGFFSLWDIERILSKYLKQKYITMVSVSLLFLSSFGVYLGRYLRWNSWDIIQNPFGLAFDISDRFLNPFAHSRTWGMTIFMGLLLCILYFSFKFIKKRE
ncbi:DUF1361 domain-containing protein [Bacteroides sp. 224]|uniref:DUF1361 domain-containing protein n=1 Tax=Bacteroides sp. 224 TaxID=2302936 RepID=UPI0013D4D07D|nr:DUF1361 domain-containing protein [Bacteroides sp. 224]NDV66652.1 DUF1361 domain-containing protein [Bacteroides sp. 224]